MLQLLRASVLAALLVSPVVWAQDKEGVRVLDATPSLPVGLGLSGDVVGRLRYADRTGTHLVVLTESKPTGDPPRSKDEEPTQSKRLYAYAFEEKKKRPKRRWELKDFELECAFDLTVSHMEGSLGITDLDKDGVAEVSFVYQLQCTSDVSPSMVKLMLYEGKDKYALRGQERVMVGMENEKPVYIGGESVPDPAFKKAPPVFLAHAREVWNRHAGVSPTPASKP